MKRRWLPLMLALVLLASVFSTGVSAEGLISKGSPVLTFTPANTTIAAQAGGPRFISKLLGEFKVDGITSMPSEFSVTKDDLSYMEGGTDLLDEVRLVGNKLYATFRSPVAATGKADLPIKFTANFMNKMDGHYIVTFDETIATVSVYTPVSTVTLPASLSFAGLEAAKKLTATVNVAAEVEYVWTSSAPAIVKVDKGADNTADVTPLAEGTATITVIAKNKVSSKSASCTVTVSKLESESVAIDPASIIGVKVDELKQLTATITGPVGHTDTVKSWSSSDTSVATIDGNGLLTPIKEGVTVITVTTAHGKTHAPSVIVGPANEVPSDPVLTLSGPTSAPDTALVIKTPTVGAKIYYTKTDDGKSPTDLTLANAATAGTLYTGPIALPQNKTYKFNAIAIKDGKASAQVSGSYTIDIAVTGFTLDKAAVTVTGVGTVVLTAQVVPASANVKSIVWEPVSDTGLSKVEPSADGKTCTFTTTGKKDVTVTATVTYGAGDAQKTAECVITEKAIAETGVAALPASLSIPAGQRAVLKAVVSPTNATCKEADFYFNASTTSIAVADAMAGKVTNAQSITIEALEAGVGKSETITIVTKNGLRAACVVTVTAASTKVAKPEFSHPSGTVFTGDAAINRTVTLTSATVGATFKYKLDGKDTEYDGSTIEIPANKTVTVEAWAVKSGLTASDHVTATFTSAVAVKGIDLSVDTTTITGKKTAIATATLTPEEPANKAITWKSSDASVATVAQMSGTGNELKATITAVKPGKATITVTSADGGFSKSEDVTVAAPVVETLKIFKGTTELGATTTMNSGEALQLAVKAYDSGSHEALPFVAPVWTSSDNTVARVSADGLVTIPDGVAAGKKADISVVFAGKTKSVEITSTATSQVADIVLDKDEGDYTEEITVKAATATVGAQIFYTLDGSWPTADATPFPSAGIKLDKTTRLRAVALKGSLDPSYADVTYRITIPVEKVEMEKAALTITKGDTVALHAAVTPANATNKAITWSVDNGIASIDEKTGVLKALAVGKVTVTATAGSTEGSKSGTCEVTIVDPPVTSIALAPAAATLTVGENKQLTMMVQPVGLAKTYVWKSSDETVASVNNSGLVTALKAGSASITVSVDGKSATSTITVEAEPSNIPVAPVKEVTFTPSTKSFRAVAGESLIKELGKLQPGEGETMEQVRYYTVVDIKSDNSEPDVKFDVAKDGTVTLIIPDVGDEDFDFDYEWKLEPKTLTPPFTPSESLKNSGRKITNNEVTIVHKPTAIHFEEIDVPAVAMENTQKKDVVIGKITNYANFAETNVAIKTQVSGIGGVKASIANDGTVTVKLDRPAIGTYDEVSTTLTASGCSAVVTKAFSLTVTAPVEKKIAVEAATTPIMSTYKDRPMFTLNYSDKNVTFSVPGYTVTKWSSSNTSYLKFGANGVASLRKASSTARITVKATLSDGSTVTNYVKISKIATSVVLQYKKGSKWYTFGDDPVTMIKGTRTSVRAVARPSGSTIFATKKFVSEDPTIARYLDGQFRCYAIGSTTFEYELANGFVATAKINVVAKGTKGIPAPTPVPEPSAELTLKPSAEPDSAPVEAPASESD